MSRLIKSMFALSDSSREKVIGLRSLNLDHSTEVEENETLTIEELKREAKDIIEAAEKKATDVQKMAEEQHNQVIQQIEQYKADWEKEKEELMQTTRQEAYQEGYNKGRIDGYEEFKSHIQKSKEITSKAQEDYYEQIQKSEQTMLHLAIKAAEKILKTSLQENQEYFLQIVREVIKDACEHKDVSIHVAPVNYELVLSHKEEFLALFTQPSQMIYVYANEQMNDDACMIESSFGRVDASVDSQLTEIKSKLMQLLLENEVV